MQDKNRFVGGKSGLDIDPELLQETLFNVMKQTTQESIQALEAITAMQQQRSERLNLAAKSLQEKLGDKHPDVISINGIAKSSADFEKKIGMQRTRVKDLQKHRSDEWVVFGTVRDDSGKPASGLIVRVFDKDRKYDDLLGETETDSNGDFLIVYHERDFKESNEDLPELYVMISGARGELLYTSRENLLFNAGQSEYFAIRLGKKSEAKPAKNKKTTIDPAAKTIRQKKSSS